MCYYHGTGIEQNVETAYTWFLKSANLGYARAEFMVGSYYYNGEFKEKDLEKAFEWYKRAAEHGHDTAQFVLWSCMILVLELKKTWNLLITGRKSAHQGHAAQ